MNYRNKKFNRGINLIMNVYYDFIEQETMEMSRLNKRE